MVKECFILTYCAAKKPDDATSVLARI
jgi:hypothetical protein